MNEFDFKQCVEEYPISKETDNKKVIHELNTNPVFEDIIMRTQKWYYKWFSQFLPHVCDECGYTKNGECFAKDYDGPLMGFTQSVHRITKRTVSCSYFQSSDERR